VNFWARFREGDIAHENLTALLGKSTQPNMFDSHPPFQIDGNFGGCAGIAEMLLQSSPVTASSPAKVRILPAWPKAWQEGSVRGLRARGGFEVSIKWSNSELSDVWISSQGAGNPEVSVQLPSLSGVTSTDVTVHLRRGKTAHLRFKAGRYAGQS
jgi:alpha-L-fucosidase 2